MKIPMFTGFLAAALALSTLSSARVLAEVNPQPLKIISTSPIHSSGGSCVYVSGSGGYDLGSTTFSITVANPFSQVSGSQIEFNGLYLPNARCPDFSGTSTLNFLSGTVFLADFDSRATPFCTAKTVSYVEILHKDQQALVANLIWGTPEERPFADCVGTISGKLVGKNKRVTCTGARAFRYDASVESLNDGLVLPRAKCTYTPVATTTYFEFIKDGSSGREAAWECDGPYMSGDSSDTTPDWDCHPRYQ